MDEVVVQVERFHGLEGGIDDSHLHDVLIGQLSCDDRAVLLQIRNLVHPHQLDLSGIGIVILHSDKLCRLVRILPVHFVSSHHASPPFSLFLKRFADCFAPLHLGRLYERSAVRFALEVHVNAVLVRQRPVILSAHVRFPHNSEPGDRGFGQTNGTDVGDSPCSSLLLPIPTHKPVTVDHRVTDAEGAHSTNNNH